jgi:hypothetical protein
MATFSLVSVLTASLTLPKVPSPMVLPISYLPTFFTMPLLRLLLASQARKPQPPSRACSSRQRSTARSALKNVALSGLCEASAELLRADWHTQSLVTE